MANKNEPKGFEPWGRVLSIRQYAASAITAIYPNDVVGFNSAGKVFAVTTGNTNILGVAQSYKAATGTTILVMDDPDQQYLVMDDASGSTVIVTTHINNNFDHVGTAGNATTLKSQHVLQRGGASTTQIVATAGWRLLGIVGATGSNSICRVVCNEHTYAKKTGGL